MAAQKNWRDELHNVAEFLRDPFKMRMAVAGITLAIMCFAINDPLQGKMQQGKSELSRLKSKVQTAEQVMLLRDHLDQVDDRIMNGKGNDIVVSHVIDLVRAESVDLMRIDASEPQKMGALLSVRVNMDLLGSYESLLKILHRFDSDEYLIRVEELSIAPPNPNRSTSSLNVTIRVMKEKA
ncbi:hypothetical protein Pla22_19100 [Rubripirellula amarantea]|uniref:General secretion pathway protein M n=1 Tax=Rubripirellula amarantea TaxID=2527999 RepID=A0A5C5WUI6_9BACT|nr:hypothetical protein [Rubripirellula amarantea]TWT54268.1 hypothetical protein Pla22_19100 [Rubripirellula amarantea]